MKLGAMRLELNFLLPMWARWRMVLARPSVAAVASALRVAEAVNILEGEWRGAR